MILLAPPGARGEAPVVSEGGLQLYSLKLKFTLAASQDAQSVPQVPNAPLCVVKRGNAEWGGPSLRSPFWYV